MELLEQAHKKARFLFLTYDEEFCLEFCQGTNSYRLVNPNKPYCHPLELFLITDFQFTGKKILDIIKISNKNYKWVLGFYQGYKGQIAKYKNIDFLEGYNKGLELRQQK